VTGPLVEPAAWGLEVDSNVGPGVVPGVATGELVTVTPACGLEVLPGVETGALVSVTPACGLDVVPGVATGEVVVA
jgi:hypothetical protein